MADQPVSVYCLTDNGILGSSVMLEPAKNNHEWFIECLSIDPHLTRRSAQARCCLTMARTYCRVLCLTGRSARARWGLVVARVCCGVLHLNRRSQNGCCLTTACICCEVLFITVDQICSG